MEPSSALGLGQLSAKLIREHNLPLLIGLLVLALGKAGGPGAAAAATDCRQRSLSEELADKNFFSHFTFLFLLRPTSLQIDGQLSIDMKQANFGASDPINS